MIQTMIYGANGKMGQIIGKILENHNILTVVAGVDHSPNKLGSYFPVFQEPSEYKGKVDLIIDFSHPTYLETLLPYAKTQQAKVVIATTGYHAEQLNQIKEASTQLPILYSSNMSLGINIVNRILKQYTTILNDHFDIEIIEKHHNKKLDAPSGTALLLANTMNNALNQSKDFIYGRHGESKREPKQVGIHAIRGGTIAGEHSLLFAGMDEIIELKHTALSKEIFAHGAIKAGEFLVNQNPGYYTMDDIFNF